jgi:hypothetical protein
MSKLWEIYNMNLALQGLRWFICFTITGMEMGLASQQLPTSVEYLKGLDTIIVKQNMDLREGAVFE